MSDEKIYGPEWVLAAASHYHYRDCEHYEDGSFGSFQITHHQFKRELLRAYERGQSGDESLDEFKKREDWRKRQDKVKTDWGK